MPIPERSVSDLYVNLGCDPELFFKTSEGVIGAEKIIPKGGIRGARSDDGKTIIDGVQVELNPEPNTCREVLISALIGCMTTLEEEMRKHKGVSLDFSRSVTVPKDKLKELSEEAQQFGCAPSRTVYRNTGIKIDAVDPKKYRVRAAAGHIHLGHAGFGNSSSRLQQVLSKDEAKRTVKLLDILVGNTSVLVDRDEGNIERRKFYGKAGEFRLPSHGFEYRTPSNYWLHSRQLLSLTFGMARFACMLMCDTAHNEYYHEFTKKVKNKKLKDAINNNDFDLAMENFMNIEPLILQATKGWGGRIPITNNNIREFHHFVSRIQSDGLEYWFPNNPLDHWLRPKENESTHGFYDYSRRKVADDLRKTITRKAA